MSDTTNFFDGIGSGAGAPSANLKNIGDNVYGEIVDMSERAYIPFGKQEPEKRADGTDKVQLVIILQTNERNWANVSRIPKVDPQDPNSAEKDPSEDDGKRAVYVPEGKNIQFAIGRAVQAAQAKFEVGGTLGVKVFNLKPTDKGNPLKEHQAVYTPKPAASGFFEGTNQGGTQQAVPQQAAPQQQAQTVPAAQQQAPSTGQAAPQQAAPAQQAPQGDPWASQAPQQPAAGDPWASAAPAGGGNAPPF